MRERESDRERDRQTGREFVRWCFEPSRLYRIILELTGRERQTQTHRYAHVGCALPISQKFHL